ncbi:prostaglandin G/H synthase 2-like [Daktulosphaira vitifoliae]|uniref:prostaglandin G/H synthase 2-like n=1 Tax=Daktulosphaira vitifoliae TaxID=58002 RepID=UPI0021AA49A3|nr:prostaglandin G/H synthase 2-like [Daktulosphaira vitifoliae]
MGHPLLSMNPLLFVMSTLWIREHNRVCNILFKKCPQWSDERLYDTSKLIVIGEMISIMSNEIMNAHTKYSLKLRYEPEILQTSVSIPLANGINSPDELLFATMWPSSLPDKLNLTSLSSLLFGNNRQLFVDGLSNIIQLMISQKMGMITSNNDGPATEPLTKVMLKLSREKKFQSFNNYRRHLGLVPYNNFYSLTKDKKLAVQLKNLYEDIENVELIPGMLVEKHKNGVVSSTNMAISNNLIMTAILSSPIGSESWWKQDTFGGDEGFEIVKTATIKKLICYNLIDQCKSFDVKLKSM